MPRATSPSPMHAASTEGRWYPLRHSDVRGQVVEGETVVLDRQRQLVHQLNQTASYIWERCDGHRTGIDIARALAEAFDVDVDTAAADTAAALQHFETLGLIESRSEPITSPGSQDP